MKAILWMFLLLAAVNCASISDKLTPQKHTTELRRSILFRYLNRVNLHSKAFLTRASYSACHKALAAVRPTTAVYL